VQILISTGHEMKIGFTAWSEHLKRKRDNYKTKSLLKRFFESKMTLLYCQCFYKTLF